MIKEVIKKTKPHQKAYISAPAEVRHGKAQGSSPRMGSSKTLLNHSAVTRDYRIQKK